MSLVFRPNSSNITCFAVEILDDFIVENAEVFQLQLTTNDTAVLFTNATVPVIITDEDCK